MSNGSGPISRIVVPLDAAVDSRRAIETAARLAVRAHAPLHGVFVEDEDLLRLANLPFARQHTVGAASEKLTAEQVELHLKTAADRAQRELSAAAARHHIDVSFEIVRGHSHSAIAAAAETDLVVAGASTRPIGSHFRLETSWWSAIEAAQGPIMLVQQPDSDRGSIVILLRDRGAGSGRLLQAAAQVASSGNLSLTVICPPEIAGDGFAAWIDAQLAGEAVRLQIEIAPAEPQALERRIDELDCRCLAVTAPGGETAAQLREFVERFGCDILVVR